MFKGVSYQFYEIREMEPILYFKFMQKKINYGEHFLILHPKSNRLECDKY